MRKSVFIIAFLTVSTTFSQTGDTTFNKAMTAFMNYYNNSDYPALHELFSPEMKEAVSLSVLEQQLTGLMGQAGSITNIEFLETTEKGEIYKVDHENMTLEYVIHLNDEGKMSGLRPQPFRDRSVAIIERNTTEMILPFNEEWFVFWGGTEVHKNYHVAYDNQKYAYDILMIKDKSSYNGDPKKNESYYVFGKDIIAPCDGTIVQVVTGVHDNVPGELNPQQLTGNTVVLETVAKEYILFAHLKQGSVVVKEGMQVKQGDLLGQCGNSGNTTEPHLHLSLQNQIEMMGATGGKIFFSEILVNGELKKDYLPEKGDQVKNLEN